jgi:hypothetical protein
MSSIEPTMRLILWIILERFPSQLSNLSRQDFQARYYDKTVRYCDVQLLASSGRDLSARNVKSAME